MRRPLNVEPETKGRAVGASSGKTGITMGGEVVILRDDEAKWNVPWIRRIGGVGKQMLQGSLNFQGNSMSLCC